MVQTRRKQPALVCCDWSAHAFLSASPAGSTRWCFLSELETSGGVPAKAATFIMETTAQLEDSAAKARAMLRSGVLGEYQEMVDIVRALEDQRRAVSEQFESPSHRQLRERCGVQQRQRKPASNGAEELAQRVATDLRREHHAIIDGFLPGGDAAAAEVRSLLCSMHARGELVPGRVKEGLKQQTRSDLMAWVPAAAEQPPALRSLLLALDTLVLALVQRPEVCDDLGGVPLMRAEAQCTLYPGGGSRYVKHTDDVRQRSRRLTCILYVNPPGWRDADGGSLRVHLSGSTGHRDVTPLCNRLVLFWSDARVPHEVLPTHAMRYAVSVWYHDARAMAPKPSPEPPLAAGAQTAAAGPIDVRWIRGRGYGVVATRDLQAGERVLAERPLAAWRLATTRDGRGDVAQLDGVVSALSGEASEAFWNLVDVHGPGLRFDGAEGKISEQSTSVVDGGGFEEKSAAGVWASNAFLLEASDCFSAAADDDDDDDEGERERATASGVFATCSRLNHACAPNCYAAWNPELGVQTLHALRDLPRGTELTIAYLGGAAWDSTRAHRQAQLLRKYRFVCDCAQCGLSGAALAASETRRRVMLQIREEVLEAAPAATAAAAHADVPRRVAQLCELSEAEGLPAVWQRSAVIAAMRHAKEAGDAKSALAWAEAGARSARVALGADAPTTLKFEAVVKAWTSAIAAGAPLPG